MDQQLAGNSDPTPLEARLRSMILSNNEPNVDTRQSDPGISHHLPSQPAHNLASQQSERNQQPVRDSQQHNFRSGRSRGRGRMQPAGNAHSMNASPQAVNQRGSPQQRRATHYQPAPNMRGGPWRSNPAGQQQPSFADQFRAQWEYLEQLAEQEMSALQISSEELQSKDRFRAHLEQVLQEVMLRSYPQDAPVVGLVCFGSVASGFGMPGSDMDLALVSKSATNDIFRLLEKHLLDIGHGAHLLSKTRVPILKVCENPTPELLSALREERQKWDKMTPEQREKFDHPASADAGQGDEVEAIGQEEKESGGPSALPKIESDNQERKASDMTQQSTVQPTHTITNDVDVKLIEDHLRSGEKMPEEQPEAHMQQLKNGPNLDSKGQEPKEGNKTRQPRARKVWYREKKLGPLDFPKDGVGVQCDINFANPLGLHNTQLLKCYSLCDPRVRLMILFVKAWASRRKINSARYGTLSSYGYVLMVLHFLVNVAKPPVCPNLQLIRKSQILLQPSDPNSMCDGWDVRFWRNEAEIQNLAAKGMLTHNREPLGMLLRNFFQYYAQQHLPNGGMGFAWTQNVLSLRVEGGILSKQAKGWTQAKVTMKDNVEVRHRYLFAIEDPFELEHNVARPVTHNGIVAIRDEFRRAWRILMQVGRGGTPEGVLLEPVISQQLDDEGDERVNQPLQSPSTETSVQNRDLSYEKQQLPEILPPPSAPTGNQLAL